MPNNAHCRRTLNPGWPWSIHLKDSSRVLGNFFFEPLQLDLQPPDLLVQLRGLRLIPLDDFAWPASKTCSAPASNCFFHSVTWFGCTLNCLANLADRLQLSDRLQSHLRLETRIKSTSCPRHLLLLMTPRYPHQPLNPITYDSTLSGGPKTGVHFTRRSISRHMRASRRMLLAASPSTGDAVPPLRTPPSPLSLPSTHRRL